MVKKIAVVAALLLLAACQAPQPTTPAPVTPIPPTPPVPHRSEQKPLPPIHSAGPVTKATLSAYMDAQEADLRSYLRGQPAQVARRGDTLVVTLQSDRLFDKGEISDWGDAFLRAMVLVVGHYDHTQIEVNGYSDAAASPDAATAASQKRAKAVADGLAHYGIAPARIASNGLGAVNLRVANASDAKNRRIEIKIAANPKQ